MQKTDTPMGLLRGQSFAAHFKRGAVIAVASGSVRVVSRVWLDHTSLTTQTPVPRGGVFYVPCSGWLEIAAESDAVIDLPWVADFWSGVLRRLVAPWNTGAWVTVKHMACARCTASA